MRMMRVKTLVWASLLSLCALAQVPAGRQVGAIQSVSAGEKKIVLISDAKETWTITANEGARIVQIEPGVTDMTKAKPVELSAFAAGDRMLAVGEADAAAKTIKARTLVLMSSKSISDKNSREQAAWRTRSTSGIVKSVDAEKGEVVITARAGMNETKEWTVPVAASTSLMRYADASINFADAKPAKLSDVRAGDQLRVLGDKDATASSIKTEAVVFGSFKTMAGEVVSANAATGELVLNDLETKQKITIKIIQATNIRRMPSFPGMGGMGMGGMGMGGMGGGRGQGAPSGAPASGAPPAAGQGAPPQGGRPAGAGPAGPGGGFGGRMPDMASMLERLPVVPFTEVKPGDAVLLSATRPAAGTAPVAFRLVAGMDFLLRAPSNQVSAVVASWNLDGGGGMGQ
jgi:hypothetical protein